MWYSFPQSSYIEYTTEYHFCNYNNISGSNNEVTNSNKNTISGESNVLSNVDHSLISGKGNTITNSNKGFVSGNDAPTIWRGPLVSRMTQQFFDDVIWGDLDFLILDLPPGTGDIQLTLVQKIALTGAVIVTTPQDLAVLDVQKGADMFKKVNTPVLGIIENMTHFECPHCNKSSQIFSGLGGDSESKRLEVPLLGSVPLSPDLVKSADNGQPFVLDFKNSTITEEFNNITNQIVESSTLA